MSSAVSSLDLISLFTKLFLDKGGVILIEYSCSGDGACAKTSADYMRIQAGGCLGNYAVSSFVHNVQAMFYQC